MDAVQEELQQVFLKGSAHSLSVERKHQLDKFSSQAMKVKGAGTRSRNSIIQAYRRDMNEHVKQGAIAQHASVEANERPRAC